MGVVDPRNLPLKFGQNWVSIRWNVIDVVVVAAVIVVVIIIVVVVFMDFIDPRNLPLKFGQSRVSNSWDIDDIEFPVVVVVVVGGDGVKSFSCQTQHLLCGASWVVVELGLWQVGFTGTPDGWIGRQGGEGYINCQVIEASGISDSVASAPL